MASIDPDKKQAAYILYSKDWRPERIAPVLGVGVRTVYRLVADLRRAEEQSRQDRAAYDRELYCRELAC